MAIKPIGKTIIFIFKDKVNTKGEFVRPPTASGIELIGGVDDSARQPRWAVVVAAGPDATSVEPGDEILIPALRWTNGIKVSDQTFWKTDESQVVCVKTKQQLTVLGEYVIFEPRPRKAIRSSVIIVPTLDVNALAEGKVDQTGPLASPELEQSVIIYFNDANLADFFEHNNKKLAFIKDSELIAYSPKE